MADEVKVEKENMDDVYDKLIESVKKLSKENESTSEKIAEAEEQLQKAHDEETRTLELNAEIYKKIKRKEEQKTEQMERHKTLQAENDALRVLCKQNSDGLRESSGNVIAHLKMLIRDSEYLNKQSSFVSNLMDERVTTNSIGVMTDDIDYPMDEDENKAIQALQTNILKLQSQIAAVKSKHAGKTPPGMIMVKYNEWENMKAKANLDDAGEDDEVVSTVSYMSSNSSTNTSKRTRRSKE